MRAAASYCVYGSRQGSEYDRVQPKRHLCKQQEATGTTKSTVFGVCYISIRNRQYLDQISISLSYLSSTQLRYVLQEPCSLQQHENTQNDDDGYAGENTETGADAEPNIHGRTRWLPRHNRTRPQT